MRQLSRLLKGDCILMDASGFVYNCPVTQNPATDAGPVPASDTSRLEVENAVRKAKSIVDGANRYLMKMHGEISRKADETYTTAREEGFRQGFEEGMAKALAENEQTLKEIADLLDKIEQGKEALLKQHEQAMLDISIDIARKVVGVHLTKDDKAFLNIFKKAAQGIQGQKVVRLSISRHEAKFVTSSGDYLKSLLSGTEQLDLKIMEDALPGTCILETDEVLIDASANGQLDKLETALVAVR